MGIDDFNSWPQLDVNAFESNKFLTDNQHDTNFTDFWERKNLKWLIKGLRLFSINIKYFLISLHFYNFFKNDVGWIENAFSPHVCTILWNYKGQYWDLWNPINLENKQNLCGNSKTDVVVRRFFWRWQRKKSVITIN